MSPRLASACLLLCALAAGTLSGPPAFKRPVILGGYRVLAADFHVHTFPFSASTLAPWDIVLEARRQGLDAIAIAGHNETWSAKVGQWFSRSVAGPLVLVGEEVHAPRFHMIAVGIHTTVSWRRSAAGAIDDVHAQGGIAIAAHPVAASWPAYDAEALRKLDGAEVMQPISYSGPDAARQLEQFYQRAHVTAIGSSDYHGTGPLGVCRTYVFVRPETTQAVGGQSVTEQSVMEALRAGRTVVLDRGRAWGDPALVPLAMQNRSLLEPEAPSGYAKFLAVLSRTCGVLGLVGVILCGVDGTAVRYNSTMEKK
jgi:hypothetical protein